MPVCFRLYRKGTTEAASLQSVDDEMRVHFNQEPDPDHWLAGWYDSIGLLIALGKSWDEIRAIVTTDASHAIVDWLEANYTTDHWRSVG